MSVVENRTPTEPAVTIPCCWHDDSFVTGAAACRSAGEALADQYRTNQPFPHIVIDDSSTHMFSTAF
jgi:hypothetical protein